MILPVSTIKKIAVFRALQLGDLLCIIPAMRALRNAYPQASIVLLGMPWSKFLVSRFPHYFDDFIHFPGYPGLPEQAFKPKDFTAFLSRVQGENFDLVLQMQGNGNIVNPMVELFGSGKTAGFYKKDIYYPSNGLFTEYPDKLHETGRHLKLMEHLGIELKGNYLEFPVLQSDEEELEALDLQILPYQYVCIHPGSRGAWRQWPPAYFALLADYCADQNVKVIITGTNDEKDIVMTVAGLMKQDATVVAGKTSLGAMGALINKARLLISNCTGVSHIASATETPSIVISMDGEPERWGPLNHILHRTIDWTKIADVNDALLALKDLLGMSRHTNQFRNELPGTVPAN